MADERENQQEHITPPRQIDTSWLPAPNATEAPRGGIFSNEAELMQLLNDDAPAEEPEPESVDEGAQGSEDGKGEEADVSADDASNVEGAKGAEASPAQAGDAAEKEGKEGQGAEVAPAPTRWQEAQIDEYEEEALKLIQSVVHGDGDPVAFLETLATISRVNTRKILDQELEAEAEQYVAAKYKTTPDVLAERLGTPKPVVLSDKVEAALGQLPDAVAKEIKQAYEQRDRYFKDLQTRDSQFNQYVEAVQEREAQQMTQSFQNDFFNMERESVSRLVKANGEVQESVLNAAHTRYAQSPEGKALMDAYEESVFKGEPAKRQENHKKQIAAHYEKMVRRELSIRGMKAADESKQRIESAGKNTKTPQEEKGQSPKPGPKGKAFNPADFVGKNILDLPKAQQEAVLRYEMANGL